MNSSIIAYSVVLNQSWLIEPETSENISTNVTKNTYIDDPVFRTVCISPAHI